MMIVIFVIGVIIDILVFGNAERFIRRRYGLTDDTDDAHSVPGEASGRLTPRWSRSAT